MSIAAIIPNDCKQTCEHGDSFGETEGEKKKACVFNYYLLIIERSRSEINDDGKVHFQS